MFYLLLLLIKDGRERKERLGRTPHPSRYTLDTFSRLGEGFYSCAVFMLLGRSIQHSQTDTNDQCTQPRPRGTLMQSAQVWRSQTKGESRKRTEESLLSSGRFRLSPATGVARATSSLKPAAFPSTTQVLCYFPCTPRATALRQARVSGGNVQTCAPSAACGGAMTEERNVSFVSLRPPRPK